MHYARRWSPRTRSRPIEPSFTGSIPPPHRLMVDLLPFGAIEKPDRTIAWPPDDQPVLSAFGFDEAAAGAVPVALPSEVSSFPLSRLPGRRC